MKKSILIKTLFVDIGGVLLTNGWDHYARRRAAKHFKLDWTEMEERHGLNFETHEVDKIIFDEYLDRVVFYKKRPFTRTEFRRFMFAQSKPYAEMIELVRSLKAKYGLKIIFFVGFKVQPMPFFHLCPVQIKMFRRPLAGMMIPAVGEQDTANVHK